MLISFGEMTSERPIDRRLALTGRGVLSMIILVIVMAGCAARPGPESLLPVASDLGEAELTVLTATNRALSTLDPPTYGGDRGSMSYEEYNLRVTGLPDVEASAQDAADGPGFAVVERRRFGRSTFLQKTAGLGDRPDASVLLFVHGYNNSYQEALFRLAGMAAESGRDVVPVLFSWPSAASVTDYVADRDSSTYARDDLAALMTDLAAIEPRNQIVVVGHSMGAWLVMEALRQLRQQGRDDVISRFQVGLASPDIDLDVFREQVATVGPLTPPITVLVAADDRALAVSARVAGGRTRLGAVRVDDPQIQALAQQSGLRVVDISALPANNRANHDRLLALAASGSDATRGYALQEIRYTGAYILSGVGRLIRPGVR